MDKLEELKKQRVELDKKIEALEYAEQTFEEGEKMWFIDHFGNVQRSSWGGQEWISLAFVQGNIFKTGKAAELEANRRNLLTRFRAFRDECNGDWKADWSNLDKKWEINYKEKEFKTLWSYELNSFPTFGHFKNEQDIKRAIELFGDEIKKLFIDCECD